MKPKVVVVGSFVQDLTWKCAEFPRAGETVIGTFATGPGGKGSNQAVACARAGVPTVFVGAVGRDVFAGGARSFYASEGIGARFVVKPGHATGTAAIFVNKSGQNEIIVALGASAHLGPRDVDSSLVKGARVVVCQHESSLEVNAHVFRLARSSGAATVLNPAPMRPDFDPAILRLTDVLIPNESEFVALANLLGGRGPRLVTESALLRMRDAEMHELCRSIGVPTVIVTLGRRGCFVSEGGAGCTRIPGHAGVRVVDTTGAGDAFVGGFAAGLARSRGDMVGAARLGNAAAALSVTRFGTAPAMPGAAQILRFMRGRGAGRG